MSRPTRRPQLSRRLDVTIRHRGRDRCIILEIDRATGSLSLRLHGCQRRRTYYAADLYTAATPQLALFP